jgi:hypothetical protein
MTPAILKHACECVGPNEMVAAENATVSIVKRIGRTTYTHLLTACMNERIINCNFLAPFTRI